MWGFTTVCGVQLWGIVAVDRFGGIRNDLRGLSGVVGTDSFGGIRNDCRGLAERSYLEL